MTVNEDNSIRFNQIKGIPQFELAYKLIADSQYPLGFYEYALIHENQFLLIGLFNNDDLVCTASLELDRSLKIIYVNEIHSSQPKFISRMSDFLYKLAEDEHFELVQFRSEFPHETKLNVFDKFETYLRSLIP